MWYFSRIFLDPQNPDVIYAPNVTLMRNTNGGRTFTAIKGVPSGDDYHYLWIDPNDDSFCDTCRFDPDHVEHRNSGADVMKRIAAPMVGGVITSVLMEFTIYPVVYYLWRGREFRRQSESQLS